jgi:hypothetical protein
MDITEHDSHPRLNEEEIFAIFDVVYRRGSVKEAQEAIQKKLHFRSRHRKTITAVFNVGTEFFKRDPNAPEVLATQEMEKIAERAGYGVSCSRVVQLHRLYILWKARQQEKQMAVEKNLRTERQKAVSPPIHKEKIKEVRREKAKASEQVPSQVASGQPGRRRLTVEVPVVDGLREKPSTRKRRHLVKAVDPRMTWCGHSLDGRIDLFWTNKIELCTCWHCQRWYKYATTGLLDSY